MVIIAIAPTAPYCEKIDSNISQSLYKYTKKLLFYSWLWVTRIVSGHLPLSLSLTHCISLPTLLCHHKTKLDALLQCATLLAVLLLAVGL